MPPSGLKYESRTMSDASMEQAMQKAEPGQMTDHTKTALMLDLEWEKAKGRS